MIERSSRSLLVVHRRGPRGPDFAWGVEASGVLSVGAEGRFAEPSVLDLDLLHDREDQDVAGERRVLVISGPEGSFRVAVRGELSIAEIDAEELRELPLRLLGAAPSPIRSIVFRAPSPILIVDLALLEAQAALVKQG